MMTCVSDAMGQRRRRCTRLVARGALHEPLVEEEKGGAGGLVSAAEHVGAKFSQKLK